MLFFPGHVFKGRLAGRRPGGRGINTHKKTVRWPSSLSATKTEKAIKDKIEPKDDWMTFPLIKITSGNFSFDD